MREKINTEKLFVRRYLIFSRIRVTMAYMLETKGNFYENIR